MALTRIIKSFILLILFLNFSSCIQLKPASEITQAYPESNPVTPTQLRVQTPFPTEERFQGTISIRHAWDEKDVPTLAAIIKSFQSYYPDVLFEVLSVPADTLLEKFINDSNDGMGATLLLGPAEWGPLLHQAGLVENLMQDFDSNSLNSLNQAALGAGKVAKDLVGLPYSISGVVLYRNSKLITIKASSFEDLVTLAQTSTQGDSIGAFLERSFFYSGAHLIGLGGKIIDDNNLPAFNNGIGVSWLNFLKELELAGPVNYFSDDDLERFKLGDIGWIIDGTWNLEQIAEAIGKENLAVDPWPSLDNGRMSGFVRAENVYLSTQAEVPERRAAIKFIQFLLSPEAQTRLAEIGRIPANQNITLRDPIDSALMKQVIDALNGGSTYPVQPEMAIYNLNLELALRAYFEDGLPPEQVLQFAQDAILDDLAPTSTPVSP